jgi:hypothetical protein
MFNAIFADIDLRNNGVNDDPKLYQFRVQVVF